MSDNGLHSTSAGEWRKAREEGFLITLPSGNVARLRPVALDVLISYGSLPNLLLPVAASSLFVEQELEKIGAGEMAAKYTELINHVIPAAFLEPKVVPNGQEPGEDEITLDDIDFADKVIAFNLVTGGARSLELFRSQQNGNMAALSNSEGNRVKAKRPRKTG